MRLRATLVGALGLGALRALLLGLAMSADGSYVGLVPGLILLSIGDGVVYTTMFIAASTGVASRDQGIASGMASTGTQIGAAAGLAALVLVANSYTDGQTASPARRRRRRPRAAVLVTAGGIAATPLILRRAPNPARAPWPTRR